MYIRYFVLNLNSLFWSSRILHHLDQPYPADLIPIMSHPNHKQEPLMPPVPESGSMDYWELSPQTEHFILYLTQSHRYSCLQPYRNSPWTMLPPHYHSELSCYLFSTQIHLCQKGSSLISNSSLSVQKIVVYSRS